MEQPKKSEIKSQKETADEPQKQIDLVDEVIGGTKESQGIAYLDKAQMNQNLMDVVEDAINKSKFRWRTVAGISSDSNLTCIEVIERMRGLQKEGKIIQASLPNQDGEPLFTTSEKYERSTPLTTRITSALSGRIL